LRPTSGDPLIGRTVGGGYTILEAIGAGGMGRVYRAEQSVLGKTVAIKVIHPHLAGDESATARFYAEARACSKLNHPNAVAVLDFGKTDDNLLYLVMEFLRGRDLARLVWEAGSLPWPRSADIIRQVMGALSEAHDQGIIHRDIKPENVLVEPLRTGGDFVKVVDFGLAKIRSDVAPGVTTPGLVCGTPDYMAPEQGRGLPPDPRSDLYSAAVVLYYCVTGRLPFDAELPQQVLLMHVNDPPPDPRHFTPDLPDRFLEVLMRGLAKDPDTRYQTAVEFARALHEVAAPHRKAERKSGTVCSNCGARVASGLKFCGECGARVVITVRVQLDENAEHGRKVVRPPQSSTSAMGVLPFVGRDAELSKLELARARAGEGALVALRIVGEEGVGKHRLLVTAMETARRAGDLVVCAGPDPTWSGVAYDPIARAVRTMLSIPPEQNPLEWFDMRDPYPGEDLEPAVRAGFVELFTSHGSTELDPRSRTESAVRALMFAFREAARVWGRAVFFACEQVHRMDSASVRVLAATLARPVQAPVLVVLCHTPRFNASWARGDVLTLKGISHEQVRLILTATRPGWNPEESADFPGPEVLPLHLEQILRWHMEGGGVAPPRLVDLIAARLERLPMQARRILQVLAIVGEASSETVSRIGGTAVESATLKLLSERAWITADVNGANDVLAISHALLREVTDAGTPAALRQELHVACIQAAEGKELPLEVHAMHAEHTEEPFQTLLLLERMGDRAMARGDDTAAAQALRRGLELARRELARGEMDEPERAIVIFTRKLGEALVRAGDYAEAEGVLREGLGVASRTNPEWARLEGTLGRALCARGRQAEGLRALENAVSAATRLGARGVASELLVTRSEMESLARIHRDAVKSLEAADAQLTDAIRLASPSEPLRRNRADLLLRLARAQRMAGLNGEQVLVDARALADELGLVTVRAQCDAEAAERAEGAGDRRAALSAWRRALLSARSAGDVALESLYDERIRRLGRYDIGSGS
jgi:serine/threonine-protein kinase